MEMVEQEFEDLLAQVSDDVPRAEDRRESPAAAVARISMTHTEGTVPIKATLVDLITEIAADYASDRLPLANQAVKGLRECETEELRIGLTSILYNFANLADERQRTRAREVFLEEEMKATKAALEAAKMDYREAKSENTVMRDELLEMQTVDNDMEGMKQELEEVKDQLATV